MMPFLPGASASSAAPRRRGSAPRGWRWIGRSDRGMQAKGLRRGQGLVALLHTQDQALL